MSDDEKQTPVVEQQTPADETQPRLQKTDVVLFGAVSAILGAALAAGAIILLRTTTKRDATDSSFIVPLAIFVTFAIAFLGYLGTAADNQFSTLSRRVFTLTGELVTLMFDVFLIARGAPTLSRRFQQPAPERKDAPEVLHEADRANLVAELEQRIKVAAVDEVFRSNVLKQTQSVQKDLAESERLAAIGAQFASARSRLDQAIVLLHRKANINMLVGIMLSALGIFFLGVTIVPGLFNKFLGSALQLPPAIETPLDLTHFWIHYLPRVTLVFVLELFAYFFLNLYKANAVETRYYHNEITNISARHSALMSAADPRDPELLKLVITELLKTERNGVLTKSQTTVEIARARAEAESAKDLVTVVTKLTESFGKALGRSEHKGTID